jgi:maltose alpha-D-glucosyltransferase/alpha-amylase
MNLHPPLTAWLEASLPERLLEFLPPRRWYGAKTRPIANIDVEDVAWLPGARPCALAVVGIRFADGGRDRYATLLAFVQDPEGLPVIGRIDERETTWVVEAATDAAAARALLDGFLAAAEQDHPMQRGGTLRYSDAGPTTVRMLADAFVRGGVSAPGTEQSNTSLRLDQSLAFKLFRRLEGGENPELEMERFLATHTRFRATPMLRGSLTYVSARGDSATVGVLQDWIESRGDGWSWLLAQLAENDGSDGVLAEVRALGATTAAFHAALAGDTTLPAFAPEPATPADLDGWRTALVERSARTLRLVERNLLAWPDDTRREAEAVLALESHIPALVPDLHCDAAPFLKIRIHGDYHLGQTLKTEDGFALIDFEGEPARPIEERRLKQCALKDVAGMIRSFEYAVETVRSTRSAASAAVDVRHLRGAFLDGYLSSLSAGSGAWLPDNRSSVDAWIACFEVEKALYEVEYELNNRPAWVHIPLRGILGLMRRSPERSETCENT